MEPQPKEHKTFSTHLIKSDANQGIVESIVAVMGNDDLTDDVIHPGAFVKTISERLGKIRVLDQHQTDSVNRVLGKPLAMREMTRDELPPDLLQEYPNATGGLYTKTQYNLQTSAGHDAFQHIAAGDVSEYSIGYDPLDIDFSKIRTPDGKTKTVRNLRTLKLYEYSPVVFGANEATTTLSAKSAQAAEEKPYDVFKRGDKWVVSKVDADGQPTGDPLGTHDSEDSARSQVRALYANEGKAASGAAGLPLADRARAWDATAAEGRVRSWAGATDAPNAKYGSAFFWHDASAADNFTSYKLQFADVIDGKLTAIPRGIFAVAAVLQGSRGGTSIPAGDQASIKSKVAAYYKRMASEFNDDSIVVPWQKSIKSTDLTGLIEDVTEAFNQQYGMPSSMGEMMSMSCYCVESVFDDHLIVCEMGSDDYYSVAYSLVNGAYEFAAMPEWIAGEMVFAPGLDETGQMQKRGDKAAPSIKAGRIFAARNETRLRAILKLVNEALAEIQKPEPDEAPATEGKSQAAPLDSSAQAGPSAMTPTEQMQIELIDIEQALNQITLEV